MKKLILIAGMIIVVGITYGQTLQKGNLVGLHVSSLNLDPDVTLNQYLDFFKNKFIPEYEINFQGAKCYLATGIRGESANCICMFIIFKSQADRDKYWKEDGNFSEKGQAAFDKTKPIRDEMEKLGKITPKYTDWLIQ